MKTSLLKVIPSMYRENNLQLFLNRLMKRWQSRYSLVIEIFTISTIKIETGAWNLHLWYRPIIMIAVSNCELKLSRDTKYDISSCISTCFNIITCFRLSAIGFLFFSSHLIDNYTSLVMHHIITYISAKG